MCDADEQLEKEAGSVAVTKMPYHEWVIAQARLYELDRRDDLAIDGTIEPLTEDEHEEFMRLKERFESKDETTFVLMHHCEAITGGVKVPADHVKAVSNAILSAYCVFRLESEYLDARRAVEAALATLGVPASELPFIVGSTEWKAALAASGDTEDDEEEVEAGAGLNIIDPDYVEEESDDE